MCSAPYLAYMVRHSELVCMLYCSGKTPLPNAANMCTAWCCNQPCHLDCTSVTGHRRRVGMGTRQAKTRQSRPFAIRRPPRLAAVTAALLQVYGTRNGRTEAPAEGRSLVTAWLADCIHHFLRHVIFLY